MATNDAALKMHEITLLADFVVELRVIKGRNIISNVGEMHNITRREVIWRAPRHT